METLEFPVELGPNKNIPICTLIPICRIKNHPHNWVVFHPRHKPWTTRGPFFIAQEDIFCIEKNCKSKFPWLLMLVAMAHIRNGARSMLYPSAMALFQPILEDQPHRWPRWSKGGRERLPGSCKTDRWDAVKLRFLGIRYIYIKILCCIMYIMQDTKACERWWWCLINDWLLIIDG